jgi:tRNA A-37 threonylcarbamoyl transferase component Bud32
MTAERWKRIEQLYHSALQRPESERSAYLRQACPDDQELLGEVEDLLRSGRGEASFLEVPAFAAATDPGSQGVTSGHPSQMLMPGSTGSRLSLSQIPPAMLETAAARLSWVALVCPATAVVMAVMQHFLQPEVAQLQKQVHIQINTAVVIVLSLVIFAARHFAWVSDQTILRLGLVFEVVVGFALATFEYSMPWDPQQPVRGVSWMALWIALCGLLIPNRPSLMTTAAIATASMGPLAYVIFHPSPIPINRLVIWNFPNYLIGMATALISRRLYHLEVQVQQAKEMGSYKLEALIDVGGMGEVWRARHRMLARDSAIKVIRPHLLVRTGENQAGMIRRRFEQEAKTTALLRSPHTVALYDFGTSKDGGFYYVMELLDGIDLEKLVRRFGPQPPSRVIHILRQVCNSLAEAHRMGMVHRDIKPTNIFLCRVGVDYDFAKVLDFGLVKTIIGEAEPRMTAEGCTTGTPAYMPPEVALSREQIDGRADLYGLGCVAYWLLTGRLVFEEKTSTATILAHVQNTPVAPSERSGIPVPASLERLTLACLAKSPTDRPAGAEALANMLADCTDAGFWSQEDAERWWRIHLPKGVETSAARGEVRASTSTAAIPTL